MNEILELTVSIERTVFKVDGYPKEKLFQSAKAGVPRGLDPAEVSKRLQGWLKVQLDIFEHGSPPAKTPTQAEAEAKAPAKPQEQKPSEQKALDAPICPECGRAMKPSKKGPGFYCTGKDENGNWCKGKLQ